MIDLPEFDVDCFIEKACDFIKQKEKANENFVSLLY